jgi:aspartyl/asparaginyl beta-hydroxylase
MQTVLKLPLQFDAARLQEALAQVSPDVWPAHSVRIHYDEGWGGIALRSGSGRADDLDAAPIHTYRNTPLLEQSAYLREVLAAFQCPLSRVRLLRLAVGTVIHEHVDEGFGSGRNQLRLHVPIQTNPGVEFYSDGRRVTMAPGECWFIDTTYPHRLANRGDQDRVHLVIDCVVDEWLLAMFPPGFAKPDLTRRIYRKIETTVFLARDIARAVSAGDASEVNRRAKRLVKWIGGRWIKQRYERLVRRLARGSQPVPAKSSD